MKPIARVRQDCERACRGGRMTGIFVAWNPAATNGMAGWVEDGSGCHIWVGARTHYGYGHASYRGRMGVAHRIRYELEVGPIPKGMVLDHYACDNGHNGCCNPAHVRPVTPRENLLRGNTRTAECASKTHCKRGHELVGDNLITHRLIKRGKRECRECRNLNQNNLRARKRAA